MVPGAIEAIAGNGGVIGFEGDDGPALEAQFENPMGIALDREGNLYVADAIGGIDHSVRRVDVTGTITTAAGTGTLGFNGDGLKARLTALEMPTDVAVDRCGNLLIVDQTNDRLRRVSLTASCDLQSATVDSPARLAQGPPWLLLMLLAGVAGAVAAVIARRRHGPGGGP